MEVRIENETVLVPEEQLERCRMCGKSFKPYKITTHGRESESSICEDCRKKYA